ncbi:MAG: replication factor C large subunit [Candidatus Bathyarchaeota archaeon]|nr:MAG: replication factor C large subunit [Candidatus Bathyarchaeota archaeon]
MWVEKYRPKRIAEIVGNEEAKVSFVEWLRSNRWRKKAALLYGPPGVGKSALVHAAANELNFKIIEMNASDIRTEKAIGKIAGPATTFVALDKFSANTEGSLLFLDEVDGIFGVQDRGGVGAILKIFAQKKGRKEKKTKERKEIQGSQIPVVLAANDPDLRKLRPLRKVCHLIRFRKVRIPLIVVLLQKICLMEHVTAGFEALEAIARNSGGDVRSAINDLQTLSEGGEALRVQDVASLHPRNRSFDFADTLKGVFSAKSSQEAMSVLNSTTIDFDSLVLSIHDNLPLRCKDPVELGVAYDLLSKADVFRGRIGLENWRLLKYFFSLISQATTVSSQPFQPFDFIFPPMRIIALFWTKGKRVTLEALCAKIGARCHVSRRSAKLDFVPFIKAILKEDKSAPLGAWFQLDDKEMGHLMNMGRL